MASLCKDHRSSASHAPFAPPQLSPDDLLSFHQTHFSTDAVSQFVADFFNPGATHEPQQLEEPFDDDDGLGYYEDGVKRTLTDEQIAMFRHSEIEALRRQRRKRPAPADQADLINAEEGEVEDDKLQHSSSDQPTPNPGAKQQQQQQPSTNGKKKNKKRKGNKGKQQEPKPDLRKRTWDVVETGLDTLEYD